MFNGCILTIVSCCLFFLCGCGMKSSLSQAEQDFTIKMGQKIWALESASSDTLFFKAYNSSPEIELFENIDFGASMEMKESSIMWKIKEYADESKMRTINTYSFSEIKDFSNSEIIFSEIVYKINTDKFSILKWDGQFLILLKSPTWSKK